MNENEIVQATTEEEVKMVTEEILCPHCNEIITIERPVSKTTIGRRGKLSGIKLEEMTDDQLKVELTNSKSVLYKAKKRGAAADVIAKNEERVAAAEALKAERDAAKKPETATEEVVDTETVYDEEVANEI